MSLASKHAIALIAEDEPILRMEAADTLEDAGFTVLEAGNVAEAIRHFEQTDTIELLFTDVQMPGIGNGFDLAHEVSARWPHVSIVVCSGAVQPSPGDLPPQVCFISKPFSAQLMIQTVNRAMA